MGRLGANAPSFGCVKTPSLGTLRLPGAVALSDELCSLDSNNLPLAPGAVVLGGIARGLNTIQWQVLISFQPPDVWQRKGLVSFKLVHKVTGMAMRVSGEEKTAFVYVATRI